MTGGENYPIQGMIISDRGREYEDLLSNAEVWGKVCEKLQMGDKKISHHGPQDSGGNRPSRGGGHRTQSRQPSKVGEKNGPQVICQRRESVKLTTRAKKGEGKEILETLHQVGTSR